MDIIRGMEHLEQNTPPGPEYLLLSSRKEYLDAFDRLAGLAQRELCIFDPNCFYLQINSPHRCELLRAFLLRSPGNRLYLAVHDTDYLRNHCPRFMGLLRLFSDRMFIRQTEGEAARVQDCFVLADKLHFVRRPVHAQPRGAFALYDGNESLGVYLRFSEIWEASFTALSATTSGL
ncbi:MAG: hypothetical protein ABIH03_16545 [Pseudomonadota bacterium]